MKFTALDFASDLEEFSSLLRAKDRNLMEW